MIDKMMNWIAVNQEDLFDSRYGDYIDVELTIFAYREKFFRINDIYMNGDLTYLVVRFQETGWSKAL